MSSRIAGWVSMRLVRIPWLLRLATRLHVAAYRATGGRLGGRLAGAPVLLLYHVGRRSGKTFVAPLLCLEDGPDLAVVASYGGSPSDPAWWLNLQGAGGWGRVQLGPRTFDIRAEVAPAPRRQALWDRFVQAWPPYDDYRKATTREIPVIILHYVETERMRATCTCLNGAWVPSR